DREGNDDEVRDDRLPSRHQHTWARRAKNSIATVTRTRSGKRKSEIPAPAPIEPESMPTAYAHVGSTCVELNGPPCVRMYTTAKSTAVNTIPNSTATSGVGTGSGHTTDQRCLNP